MKIRSLSIGLVIIVTAVCFAVANTLVISNPSKSIRSTLAAPAVGGWYFRTISDYPAAISFEPVALFKNGDIGRQVQRHWKI